MTRLFAVLALALVLVLSLGVSAWSGVIPYEDYDRPIDGRDLGDGGGEDDDHPWGGDRVVGPGGGSDVYRYVDISVVTGYPVLDVIIARVVQSITLDETTPTVTTSNPEYLEEAYRRSYESTARYQSRSTIGNRKDR
jgi:hypothetical protein